MAGFEVSTNGRFCSVHRGSLGSEEKTKQWIAIETADRGYGSGSQHENGSQPGTRSRSCTPWRATLGITSSRILPEAATRPALFLLGSRRLVPRPRRTLLALHTASGGASSNSNTYTAVCGYAFRWAVEEDATRPAAQLDPRSLPNDVAAGIRCDGDQGNSGKRDWGRQSADILPARWQPHHSRAVPGLFEQVARGDDGEPELPELLEPCPCEFARTIVHDANRNERPQRGLSVATGCNDEQQRSRGPYPHSRIVRRSQVVCAPASATLHRRTPAASARPAAMNGSIRVTSLIMAVVYALDFITRPEYGPRASPSRDGP